VISNELVQIAEIVELPELSNGSGRSYVERRSSTLQTPALKKP
jgi:hypothetical protein